LQEIAGLTVDRAYEIQAQLAKLREDKGEELPDVAYANMKLIKGMDLIATNVTARKVLNGKAMTVKGRDLNPIKLLRRASNSLQCSQ